jgi:hypothetical protein
MPQHLSPTLKAQAWKVVDNVGTFYVFLLLPSEGGVVVAAGSMRGQQVEVTAWLLASLDATSAVVNSVSRVETVFPVPTVGPNVADLVCFILGNVVGAVLPAICSVAYILCRLATTQITGLLGILVCTILNGPQGVDQDLGWYAYPRGFNVEPDTQSQCIGCSTPYFLVEMYNLYGDPPCDPASSQCEVAEENASGVVGTHMGPANVTWNYVIDWPDGSYAALSDTTSWTVAGGVDQTHALNVPPGNYATTIGTQCQLTRPTDGGSTIGEIGCTLYGQPGSLPFGGTIVNNWTLI